MIWPLFILGRTGLVRIEGLEEYRGYFGLLAILIGTAIAVLILRWMWTGIASYRWPRAEARVVRSELRRVRGSRGGWMYAPQIVFTFDIDGKTYRRSNLYPDADVRHGLRWLAERWTKRYPVGATVRICYPPGRPSRASLQPGGPWVVAAVMLAVAVTVAVLGTLHAVDAFPL